MTEEAVQAVTESVVESGDFDMDKAIDSLSADLFPETGKNEPEPQEASPDAEESPEIAVEQETQPEPVVTVKPPPQSWAKEHHEDWAKMPPTAQDYYMKREQQMLDGLEQYKGDAGFGKQMREVMTPYKAMLQAQGVNEQQAAQYLFNAHYRLTTSEPAQKQAYFANLARSYGIDLTNLPTVATTAPDPIVQELQRKVDWLTQTLTAQQQAQLEQTRTKVNTDVSKFVSDPAHPYFDEVADDIVAMIQAGQDLPAAYEKAVWANPVTRQKEIARLQTEQQAQFHAKAKAEAEAARKASSTNVRSRDTAKPPTGTKGKLFSSEHEAEMREIVRKQSTH